MSQSQNKDKPWIENEELFRQEMQTGHEHERFLGGKLSRLGFDVELSDHTFRDDVSEIDNYKDEQDLIVEGYICEVKSRDLDFTKPSNFPYEHIFVDTVEGWEQKEQPPHVVLCISQETRSTIMLSRSTKNEWDRHRTSDTVRGIDDTFYRAHRDLWEPFDYFINRLIEQKT